MKSYYSIVFIISLIFLIFSCGGKKTPVEDNVQEKEEKKADITHIFNDYNFHLKFPGDWKDYKVVTNKEQVTEGIIKSIIYVGLPTVHDWPAIDFPVGYASMLMIFVFNFNDSGEFQDYLKSSNINIGTQKYKDEFIYFGYVIIQDCPEDLNDEQKQVSGIMKTFSFWGNSQALSPGYEEGYIEESYSYYYDGEYGYEYSYDTYYYSGYENGYP